MSSFENVPKTFGEMWTNATETGGSIKYIPDIDGILLPYDGNPLLTPKGMLLERRYTNPVLHNRDLTNAAWTASGTGSRNLDRTGADDSENAATRMQDTSSGASYYLTLNVTLSGDNVPNDYVPYTASAYVHKDSNAGVALVLFGGDGDSGGVRLNPSTGAVTPTNAHGTPHAYTCEDSGDWWRISVTVMLFIDSSSHSGTIRIYPAYNSIATGSPAEGSVTATGEAIIDFVQIDSEALGPFSASESGTTAFQTEITNEDCADWLNTSEITLLIEYDELMPVTTPETGKTTDTFVRLTHSSGSVTDLALGVESPTRADEETTNRLYLYPSDASTSPHPIRYYDFASSGKMALSYSLENQLSVTAVNGNSQSITSTGTDETVITAITLKSASRVIIKRLKVYKRALSASELEALTAP